MSDIFYPIFVNSEKLAILETIVKTPFVKKKIVTAAVIIVVAVAGGYMLFGGEEEVSYESIIATRGKLVQEVSVTGRVEPSASVNLGFAETGRVARVYVEIRDFVFAGQVLAELENSDTVARRDQARATVAVEQAKLDNLLAGVRSEEIAVQEVKVSNAQASLAEAKRNLVNKIEDAFTKSDDAVRNRVDQLFDRPRSSNPLLTFSLSDGTLKQKIETTRLLVESLLTSWRDSLMLLSVDSDLDVFVGETQNNLEEIQEFLADVALAVNSLNTSATLSQTTINNYRSDISTARTNVNTAIVNLATAKEKLTDARSDLSLASQELVLKKAPATAEDITTQSAKIAEAAAVVNQYQALLAKTIIRAPFSGTVTKRDVEVGEIAVANTAIVSLISTERFDIKAQVPEADIALVSLGNQATLTLDAFGDDLKLNAVVHTVDPAETVIEGVSTYTVVLRFADVDDRVRSGMTANIKILTGTREDIIAIPSRAIMVRDSDKFVQIVAGLGEIEERQVVTGMRGSDGRIEIVEGILEGEEIIIFIRQ